MTIKTKPYTARTSEGDFGTEIRGNICRSKDLIDAVWEVSDLEHQRSVLWQIKENLSLMTYQLEAYENELLLRNRQSLSPTLGEVDESSIHEKEVA